MVAWLCHDDSEMSPERQVSRVLINFSFWAFFAVPLLLITALYTHIIVVLRRSAHQLPGGGEGGAGARQEVGLRLSGRALHMIKQSSCGSGSGQRGKNTRSVVYMLGGAAVVRSAPLKDQNLQWLSSSLSSSASCPIISSECPRSTSTYSTWIR